MFLSLRDGDKGGLHRHRGVATSHMGFKLYATRGTARFLGRHGIDCERSTRCARAGPDIVDHIKNGKIQLIINTPLGKKAQYDELAMRLRGARATACPASPPSPPPRRWCPRFARSGRARCGS